MRGQAIEQKSATCTAVEDYFLSGKNSKHKIKWLTHEKSMRMCCITVIAVQGTKNDLGTGRCVV